jgi:hypothetical protein
MSAYAAQREVEWAGGVHNTNPLPNLPQPLSADVEKGKFQGKCLGMSLSSTQRVEAESGPPPTIATL